MSSFQNFCGPKELRTVGVEQALSVELQDRERACSTPTTRNSFGLLPLGNCERKTHKF